MTIASSSIFFHTFVHNRASVPIVFVLFIGLTYITPIVFDNYSNFSKRELPAPLCNDDFVPIRINDLNPWAPWKYNQKKCTLSEWLSQEVHVDRRRVLKALRNKQIVMIGDSVSRYQYLNLAYYLRTGSWCSPKPRNEWEKDHHNWTRFFRTTNARLGTEVCDCYRVGHIWSYIRENRFYHDTENSFRLSFFLQLGMLPNVTLHTAQYMNFSCTPRRCVQRGCAVGACPLSADPNDHLPDLYGQDLWGGVPIFMPNTTHMIVNQGVWVAPGDQDQHEATTIAFLNQASRRWSPSSSLLSQNSNRDVKYVWKTTSGDLRTIHNLDEPLRDRAIVKAQRDLELAAGDAPLVRGRGWKVFDLALLLQHIRRNVLPIENVTDFTFDYLHLSTRVNAAVNRAMLVEMFGSDILDRSKCRCL
eukprot:PhM_4_TR2079/c0_g1_i1/m.47575